MFRKIVTTSQKSTSEPTVPNISTFANTLANPLTLDPFAFNDIGTEPNTMKTTTSKSRQKPKVNPVPVATTKRRFSQIKHHSPKHPHSPKHTHSPKHPHSPKHTHSPKHPHSPKHHSPKHPRSHIFDPKPFMRNVLTSPMIPPTTHSKSLDELYNRFIQLNAEIMERKENLDQNRKYVLYLIGKLSKLDPNEKKLLTDRLRESDHYIRIMSILTSNNGNVGDKDYKQYLDLRLYLSDLLHNSLRTKVLLTERLSPSGYEDTINWFNNGIIISVNVHGTTMPRTTSDKIPVLDMFELGDVGLDSVSNAYFAEIGTICNASVKDFNSFHQNIQDALQSTHNLSIEGVSDIVRRSLHGKMIKNFPSKSERDNSHNHMKSMYQPGLFTLDVVNAASSSKKILNKEYSCDKDDRLGIRMFTAGGISTFQSCPSKITTKELLRSVKHNYPDVTHVYLIDPSCSTINISVFNHYIHYIHDKTASFTKSNRIDKDTLDILRRLVPNEATRERGGAARKRRTLRKKKYSIRARTRTRTRALYAK